MKLTLRSISLGLLLGAVGVAFVAAADDRPQIAGGIEGKVKMVDVEHKKLTITTPQGMDRTFTVTDETVLLGPLGGKIHRHLADPRFHAGFPVTVVAKGMTASEVHLGFARDEATGAAPAAANPTAQNRAAPPTPVPNPGVQNRVARKVSPPPTDLKKVEAEDDNEIPGTVKSFDITKRILVVTLLNGTNRSFMLANDVPVHVRGAVSKRGLQDPALKPGASVNVITEEGGRKVKDLQVVQVKAKRAG